MKKITYEEVAKTIQDILAEFKPVLGDIEFVVGISRGGLFPAMVAATTLVKPLTVAYIDKEDNVYFDRTEWIKDKSVLLVDDIVRTGKTMGKIKTIPLLCLRQGHFLLDLVGRELIEVANKHLLELAFCVHWNMVMQARSSACACRYWHSFRYSMSV